MFGFLECKKVDKKIKESLSEFKLIDCKNAFYAFKKSFTVLKTELKIFNSDLEDKDFTFGFVFHKKRKTLYLRADEVASDLSLEEKKELMDGLIERFDNFKAFDGFNYVPVKEDGNVEFVVFAEDITMENIGEKAKELFSTFFNKEVCDYVKPLNIKSARDSIEKRWKENEKEEIKNKLKKDIKGIKTMYQPYYLIEEGVYIKEKIEKLELKLEVIEEMLDEMEEETEETKENS